MRRNCDSKTFYVLITNYLYTKSCGISDFTIFLRIVCIFCKLAKGFMVKRDCLQGCEGHQTKMHKIYDLSFSLFFLGNCNQEFTFWRVDLFSADCKIALNVVPRRLHPTNREGRKQSANWIQEFIQRLIHLNKTQLPYYFSNQRD